MNSIPLPDLRLPEESFEKIPADRVLEGTPAAAFHVVYTSASGDFSTGLYACTAGKWRVSYSEDEVCTLLEGTVCLTNDDNQAIEYQAPASFVIPAGFSGTWHAKTPVRKIFAIYEKMENP